MHPSSRPAARRAGAAGLALALLAACAGPPGRPTGRTLRVGVTPGLHDFGLSRVTAAYYAQLAGLVFEGLTRTDESGALGPALARRWAAGADGRTWTFTLRADATFHDGTRCTARDVIRAWTAALRVPPGAPDHPWMLDGVTGALAVSRGEAVAVAGLAAPDDTTLVVRLDAPLAPFPAMVSMVRVAVPAPSSDSLRPVGTGPWRWVAGPDAEGEIRFARFAGYAGRPPRADSLVLRPAPGGTVLRALAHGRVDWVQDLGEADLADISGESDFGVVTGPPVELWHLALDFREPALQDVRVRRAIAHAVDGQRLAEVFVGRRVLPANGLIPPGWPGFDSTLGPLPHDPDLARRELAASGYPPGRPLRIVVFSSGNGTDGGNLGHLLVEELEAVGFRVVLQEVPGLDSLQGTLHDRHADISIGVWTPDYADTDSYLVPLVHSSVGGAAGNDGGFADPEVDRLLDRSRATADDAERAALFRAVNRRLRETVAHVPLVFAATTGAFRLGLRGWRPTSFVPRYLDVAPVARP